MPVESGRVFTGHAPAGQLRLIKIAECEKWVPLPPSIWVSLRLPVNPPGGPSGVCEAVCATPTGTVPSVDVDGLPKVIVSSTTTDPFDPSAEKAAIPVLL